MKIQVIKKKDFTKSSWEGGETSQLFIYPPGSELSKRDFLFRISSASFTSNKSKFSDFSGYSRYLLPLRGRLRLDHIAHYKKELAPYEVDYFDGSWTTFSENSKDCLDYNFIAGSRTRHAMKILKKEDKHTLLPSTITSFYSQEDYQVKIQEKTLELEASSLLLLEVDKEEEILISKLSSPLILTEFGLE